MPLIFFSLSLFLSREWRTYFKDPFNYFDWLGLVLTFLVIPLRFVEVRYQWSVAGLGYLFNFLRLFKFSCVTRYSVMLDVCKTNFQREAVVEVVHGGV